METQNEQLNIKSRVMKNVYTIWFVRKIAPILILEVLLFGMLALGIASAVSVSKIASNAFYGIGDMKSLVGFFSSAFTNTTLMVQVLAFSILAASFLLLRDMIRTSFYFIGRRKDAVRASHLS
ncbi:MAG: hypothetical protein Q7R73_03230 [bacterium]|nr:hypothetical protein [bacterium]